MKILAIETATDACSAALLLDNNEIIERFEIAPREHTKRILPMMDSVLEEGGLGLADLDAIAFSRGPGAFTGLRIAAGIAQGVALSHDLPVAPVSTLSALALLAVEMHQVVEGDWQDDVIIAALDARMGEIYWGTFIYQDDTIKSIAKERVTKPEELSAMVAKNLKIMDDDVRIFAIGSGWDAYQDVIFNERDNEKDYKANLERITHMKSAHPRAEHIAELAMDIVIEGKTVSAEEAQPIYIRNNVADKPKKKAE